MFRQRSPVCLHRRHQAPGEQAIAAAAIVAPKSRRLLECLRMAAFLWVYCTLSVKEAVCCRLPAVAVTVTV